MPGTPAMAAEPADAPALEPCVGSGATDVVPGASRRAIRPPLLRPAELPLHAAARLAVHQRLDLAHADPVEVARDGVLETRGGRRELERRPVVAVRQQAVDQPCAEGIPGADAVHDVGDLVLAAR